MTDRTLGTVTACTADGTTGALGNCGTPVTGFTNPTDATVSGNNLFVTNFGGNTVGRCAIGSDGSLSGCTDAGVSNLNQPTDIVINGNYAYIVQFQTSTISRCGFDSATGALSNCSDSGASGLVNPIGMDIKGNVAYISNNGDSSISQCSIDATNGNLSCPANRHFNGVKAVSPYSVTASGNYIYIVNQGAAATTTAQMTQSSITRCNINATTGDVDPASCVAETGITPAGLSATDWYQFNRMAVKNNTAYITARNIGKVIQCSVSAETGALSGCTVSTPAFNGATGIAIK